MSRILTGLRMVITGASSGIGLCLAEQAAQKGARLILMARSQDKLADLCARIRAFGKEALAVVGDITLEDDRQQLLETVQMQMGGADVLVNNAGVASFGHFAESSEEILRRVMEVNFFAPAELIRAFIPVLTNGNKPAIVNVASMCGKRGMPAWPEYSASKFALCGLTEALRGEMARFEIDVLLIVPGLTRSDLSRHFLRNEGRMKFDFQAGMAPEYVATRIIQSLEKSRNETILGGEARWLLLTNRFLPGFVDWLITRRVRKLYEEAPAT
jgi:short-subunit dehydrogenase